MTFAQEVRDELVRHYVKSPASQRAELAALMMMASKDLELQGNGKIVYEDPRNGEKKTFNAALTGREDLACLTKKPEGKRAFLRGTFIAVGVISDPAKEYRLEIPAPDEVGAAFIMGLLEDFGIEAKSFKRRGKVIVYVKGAEKVADVLRVIEAPNALMNFENIKIEREINGAVSRKINCDTANINKTISASMKQIEDFETIASELGEEGMDSGLWNIGQVRLNNPDASLEEIGLMCTPPIGKSGANHRFRKIAEMADKIRSKER